MAKNRPDLYTETIYEPTRESVGMAIAACTRGLEAAVRSPNFSRNSYIAALLFATLPLAGMAATGKGVFIGKKILKSSRSNGNSTNSLGINNQTSLFTRRGTPVSLVLLPVIIKAGLQWAYLDLSIGRLLLEGFKMTILSTAACIGSLGYILKYLLNKPLLLHRN